MLRTAAALPAFQIVEEVFTAHGQGMKEQLEGERLNYGRSRVQYQHSHQCVSTCTLEQHPLEDGEGLTQHG